MKLSEIKSILTAAEAVDFELENGAKVPEHFHVTEIGVVSKHFIDCGGTVRKEEKANFQLWDANDYEHRLKPQKLLHIIDLSEKKLAMPDLEIEVEYQSDTIGKYSLAFDGKKFILTNMQTACLANDKCGDSSLKQQAKACCSPADGCC